MLEEGLRHLAMTGIMGYTTSMTRENLTTQTISTISVSDADKARAQITPLMDEAVAKWETRKGNVVERKVLYKAFNHCAIIIYAMDGILPLPVVTFFSLHTERPRLTCSDKTRRPGHASMKVELQHITINDRR